MITRRFLLAAAAMTAASAAIPVSAAAPTPAPHVGHRLPAWIVGTEGEFDYEMVRASTAADAIAARVAELTGQDRCSCAPGDFDGCAYCDIAPSYDAYRVEVFDTLERDPTGAEWFSAGLGTHCDRCGFETHPETGGVAIGKFAICEDCLTLADWDVIDPQRAAEMRAEEAEAAHG